ncbi:hypothetical protein AOC36_07565 [Erysipelothrix larvae]|uniref:Uncharacterized protein n=1 Tax=Erysipelothrix larvae TaxID=1514105 RepID=A0A0X8H0L7_9FIRM|nr:DUF4311 domain-containing protein [Erysipelothrix larvae]AMC93846.1 hypothetical protein AOC36_07565 [Erysipelothrix larvae]
MIEFEIIIKAIIVGALSGGAIAAGAARMFRAPEIQGMGAFRTLGEMNACNGDSVSHFSFGLGFFITSAASAIGTGALTQDILHRVIPNWTAAVINLNKKKDYTKTISSNLIVGAIIGASVFVFLTTASGLVPKNIAEVAGNILAPASTNMINIVMPLIFLWAALDAGQTVGAYALVLAGVMQMISGNSLPGIIFGILAGTLAQEKGTKDKSFRLMLAVIVIMICMIAYFRGFHKTILGLF